MIRLGFNIDHVATLRQQRAGLVDYPDVLEAAKVGMKAGADLITVHLRGDRRHIQEYDVRNLSEAGLPINLEMAATEEMIAVALKYKPVIVCLVPEKREELTTEGGLNVAGQFEKIKSTTEKLSAVGIKVSLFIEAQDEQVKASQKAGAWAVEFHTGHYATAEDDTTEKAEYEKLEKACRLAHDLKLHVHAGHGLDYDNISKIKKLPFLEEVNIGHAIVCRAVLTGMSEAVGKMKSLIL